MLCCKSMQIRLYDVLSRRVVLILFISLVFSTLLLEFFEVGESANFNYNIESTKTAKRKKDVRLQLDLSSNTRGLNALVTGDKNFYLTLGRQLLLQSCCRDVVESSLRSFGLKCWKRLKRYSMTRQQINKRMCFFWGRHSNHKPDFYDMRYGNGRICSNYKQILPVDVVYTWTNYSDPMLQEKWRRLIFQSAKNDSTKCPDEHCMTTHIVAYRACSVAVDNIRSREPLLPADALRGDICNNQSLVLLELDSISKSMGTSKISLVYQGRNFTTSVRQTFWTTDLNDPRHIMTPNRVRVCGLSVEILSLKTEELLQIFHKLLKVIVLDVRSYPQLQCAIIKLSSVKSVDHVIVSKELAAADIYAQRVALGLYTIEHTDTRVPQDFNTEGLRYSLRSLERFAPWIRHIYLVTNGQVPEWLSVNNERISLVKHSDIFPDGKHLPTFNGAAVDSHVHRIPGLSTHFLHLTGNIIFGKDVWPEDFFSNSYGYKLYKAWKTPECSPACRWPWIGDGSCDEECDEPECGFDGGDCQIVDEPSKIFLSPNQHGLPVDLAEKYKKKDLPIPVQEASITQAIIRKPTDVKFDEGKIVLDVNKSGIKATDGEAVYVVSQFAYSSRKKISNSHSVPNAGALWAEPGQRLSDDQRPTVTSLRIMNLLLSKQLGFASQWIPAPTPMLLNKDIVSSMIQRFEDQWKSTSERRWESNLNLHFDFMYFAFMMGEYTEVSWDQLFRDFDTDNSGSWSDREMRTLMAQTQRGPLTEEIIAWFERTILSCAQTKSNETPKTVKIESTVMPERYEDSPLPLITKRLILGCEPFREQVLSQLSRRPRYEHEILDHWGKDTAFVITGNISILVAHLDDVRVNPRKFIHVQKRLWTDTDSGSMKEKAVEEAVLLDMLYSLLPARSDFELPSGTVNEVLSIDKIKRRWRTNFMWRVIIVTGVFLPVVTWWRSMVISICRRILFCIFCRPRRGRRKNLRISYNSMTVI